MGVAEPLRRPTASRGRKRPRAAARLVGTSRAACCRLRLRVNPFLVWFVSFWLLFSGVWETLIFGTGDWFAFGEPFFCGLFTPTYPLPGHRLVPESQPTNKQTKTNNNQTKESASEQASKQAGRQAGRRGAGRQAGGRAGRQAMKQASQPASQPASKPTNK